MSKLYTIRRRRLVEVNTDPQRRCYNGCHFSSEFVWTPWETFYYNIPQEDIEDKLKFWIDLNNYAVSQRGEGARCEYDAVLCEEESV